MGGAGFTSWITKCFSYPCSCHKNSSRTIYRDDNFTWDFSVANLGGRKKKKTRSSLSNVPMCPFPWPFFIFPCFSLALFRLLSAACIHESHAKEFNFYLPEDRDSFCNVSLFPILAHTRAIESNGSFTRKFMTANQTTGTDSKRYNRFQAPNWPSGTECPLSSQFFLDQPWTKEAGKLIRIRALWSKKWSFFIVAWRTPFIWQVSTLFRVDGQKSPGAWQVMSRDGHRVCS